jgi:hypothetical protein
MGSSPSGAGVGENRQQLQVVFHAAAVFDGNIYTLARIDCFYTFKVMGLPGLLHDDAG